MRRRRLIAPIVAAASLVSARAPAANEVDEAAARVLFGEGRKLAAAGDYAAACPKFEESFRLDPGIGTGFNLADCWEHINTDRMALKSKPIKIEVPAEYASQQGIRLRLADHQGDVLTGFEECYRFLLHHRAALLAPDGPLLELKPQRLRLIYRNTKVYGALLEQLLAPVHLRDGADWSIQLEALGVAVMPAAENAGTAPRSSSSWSIPTSRRRTRPRCTGSRSP